MNPAIRAIVRNSIKKNYKCFAIYEGYNGLLENNIQQLLFDDVSGIIKQGGTFIESARCLEFQNEKEKRKLAVFHLISHKIDKLVCIGGDGSLTGSSTLFNEWEDHVKNLLLEKKITKEQAMNHSKLKIVGLVGSIDNDFYGSSMMMGVDTALHRITYAIDSILTTASSHRRAFVIEVMGRDCGYLSLVSSVISGSDYVFLPESPPKSGWEEEMCNEISNGVKVLNKKHLIVILSEGTRDENGIQITSEIVKNVIEKKLNFDARITVLGHVQRGGSPSFYDRYLSTLTGYHAVETLIDENYTTPVVVGMNGMKITKIPLVESVKNTKLINQLIKDKKYTEAIEMRGVEFKQLLTIAPSLRHPLSSKKNKKIAILNIGASAPGMNSCSKTIVQYGISQGFDVFGISNGIKGLIEKRIKQFDWKDVNGWESIGGSLLGTNRTKISDYGLKNVINTLNSFEIDGLIMIGGFDGIHDMSLLAKEKDSISFPIVCIPATISNNCPGTNLCIGTDTALNNLLFSNDSLSNSAVATSQRIYVIEVMGGYCGCLSVLSCLTSGGAAVYLAEKKLNIDTLTSDLKKIKTSFTKEQQIMLFFVNQNTSSLYNTPWIKKLFDVETDDSISVRDHYPGHMIAGGSPTPLDRVRAIRLSASAIGYLSENNKESIILGLNEHIVTKTRLLDFDSIADVKFRRPKDQWWESLDEIIENLSYLRST